VEKVLYPLSESMTGDIVISVRLARSIHGASRSHSVVVEDNFVTTRSNGLQSGLKTQSSGRGSTSKNV
jgi:hypothetical protein